MSQRIPRPPLGERLTTLPRLFRDPIAFFSRELHEHGPIVKVHVGAERIVVVGTPELVHELLVKHSGRVRKDEITGKLRFVLGDGLLTSEGATWRGHRRLIAPSFQRDDLRRYAAQMVAAAERKADRMRTDEVLDVHEELMELTLDIVADALFGLDEDLPVAQISQAVSAYMDRFVLELRTWRRMMPERVLDVGRRPLRTMVERLDGQLMDVVARRRTRPLGHDLLSRLIAARDDEGVGFDDEELVSELKTLIVAGHETTAIALTWACVRLAERPELVDAVRAELAAHGDGPPSADDLRALPRLRSVVLETLRLHPPAWAIARAAEEDFELGGWQIRRGDDMTVIIHALHRSPTWFDDPLAFRPERWDDGLEQRLPRGAFLPFGGGPRICVGNHFAMMEMMLVLASWLRRFDLERAGPLPAQAPAITHRPLGPVPIRFTPRADADDSWSPPAATAR